MKTDIEIAQSVAPRPIQEIADQLGLSRADLEPYGHTKAKIDHRWVERAQDRPNGRLVLVTAITPTPAGEGKSTTTVGLGQALQRRGRRALIALREPSLGPCFGIKGGAAGGGWSQVIPMEEINLHFTGDLHAIGTAHNLLSAMVDNHLQHHNRLGLDTRKVVWPRVVDMNDRALRRIVLGLGDGNGVPRESRFDITVASEVMAILCLATSLADLKTRLERVVVGYTASDEPVTCGALGAAGAMTALLKQAINPNLVQTLEHTPALIHGGPFANIAHGCNSVLATKLALKLGEYCITEAGFGMDLGGEKFLDIKTPYAGLQPSAVVLVATIRALKMHGGLPKKELGREDLGALGKGLPNLEKHLENIAKYKLPALVAINRFPQDTEKEVALVREHCRALGAPVALSEVWEKGGAGGLELADLVTDACRPAPPPFAPIYDWKADPMEKIETVAREIYGAAEVRLEGSAKRDLKRLKANGFGGLPICMAKTQYSFSDNPNLLGRPSGFPITVKEIRPSAGAGFLVCLTGDIMLMPGLPKVPAAEAIDIDADGTIRGLF
ncbi:MAG TPA: formate--tetrahydrofolate ligase [Acidobacteriota bacterium]